MKTVLNLVDEDDGTTSMDVVVVPEGFSFQIGMVGMPIPDKTSYISIILTPPTAKLLIPFLQQAE